LIGIIPNGLTVATAPAFPTATAVAVAGAAFDDAAPVAIDPAFARAGARWVVTVTGARE
jgi:hypothetical protein